MVCLTELNAVLASQISGVVEDINELSPALADVYAVLQNHQIFVINEAVRPPTLDWLTGIPRLRLRDDWTTHHDNAIFATLRSRLEDDNSADRADSIGHLVRLSITTGRGLAAPDGRRLP